MDIFKLIKLKVKDHDVFKESIEFDFFQVSDPVDTGKPYFTMILGPNGTGKSNLLRLIIEILKVGYEKSLKQPITKYPKGKYSLEFFLNDGYYTILNTLGYSSFDSINEGQTDPTQEKGIRLFKDGTEIEFELSTIPKSILAVSIMLNDKFPVFSNNDFSIYNYLGVKRDANTAGTRSYITKTVEMVFRAAHKKTFIDDTAELLKFLELDPNLFISYYPRYKHIFFKGNMTVELMDDFYSDYKKYLNRETEPWSVGIYRNIKEADPEAIPKLVELLNYISERLQPEYEGSRTKFYDFDIFDSNTDVINHFNYLPYLQRLDLLSYPEIVLQKQGRYFSVEDSSSGEYHLISTIISVLACITENSLVLIDEPEISLHPNWQMKYVDFLNQIFKKYYSTHFVICSHSHFLVSDLKHENSTIISLTKEKRNHEDSLSNVDQKNFYITSKQIPFNTFGWSAEEVLLEVFNVPTTRNYFIADSIGEILELVSQKDRNENLIREKVGLLVKKNVINLSDNDPLKSVWDKLVSKYA